MDLGDEVVVHLANHYAAEATTMHWHGMYQRGTPFYDGVDGPWLEQISREHFSHIGELSVGWGTDPHSRTLSSLRSDSAQVSASL